MPPTRRDHHRCPGGCARTVPNHLFACPQDWARLPQELQAAILDSHGRDRERHADAMLEARDWYLEHPSPTAPDARISGVCEHCSAALLWLTTSAGKRMPVNAEPDPERGNVMRSGGVAGVLGASLAAAARAAGKPLWLHHVVTCPHADRWRSKPAAGAARKARR
jgi:hypothetical protein